MRKVTYGGAVSLDGFLAGPGGALDWLHFSRDVQQIIAEYWKNVDTVLMGRKTYAAAQAQGESGAYPSVRTYVFSRTLREVKGPGIELVSDDAAAFVRGLKQQPGKEICLMGGGELAQSLLAAGLVDEVGLNIHPVLLGSGVPVFRDPGCRIALKLRECRQIGGGCILATYDVG